MSLLDRIEIRCLREACRLEVGTEADRENAGAPATPGLAMPVEDFDGERLVDLAFWHRVAPQLARHLWPTRAGERSWRQKLRAGLDAAATSMRRQRWEIRRLARALDAAGVEMLWLKGAALAYDVYPDPAARPMTDLDLLVREEAIELAASTVRALGFTPARKGEEARRQERFARHYPELLSADGRIRIELHRHLVEPGGALSFDIELLWRGGGGPGRSIELGGTRGRILEPSAGLLHLALDLFRDSRRLRPSGGALGRLLDIALLIRRHKDRLTDTEEIATLLSAPGLAAVAGLAVDVTQEMLGVRAPDVWPGTRRDLVEPFLRRRLLRAPEDIWELHALVDPPDPPTLIRQLRSAGRRLLKPGTSAVRRRLLAWLLEAPNGLAADLRLDRELQRLASDSPRDPTAPIR